MSKELGTTVAAESEATRAAAELAVTADIIFKGDPKSWLETIRKTSAFTIVVYYRGIWCPYCRAYLEELAKLDDQIKRMGGQTIALCADKPHDVAKTVEKWGLPFVTISDRQHVLAKYLKNTALLPVVITGKSGDPEYRGTYYTAHPRMGKYENGCVQPALLVLPREGEPWFRWYIEPKAMNLGGASDRPVIKDVIAIIEGKQAGGPETCVEGSDPEVALRFTSKTKINLGCPCSIM